MITKTPAKDPHRSSHGHLRNQGDAKSKSNRSIVPVKKRKPFRKQKNVDGGAATKLLEKYEVLVEFFNSFDSSIRLLRMKGLITTFANICPKVESLTDRRFSHRHLAQLKFILPEAIEAKKVLILDERTSCMKPDIHVTLKADAIEGIGKVESGTRNFHMRKVFRDRLVEFVKSHPEGDDIPEEMLPEPFNQPRQEFQSGTIEESSNSSLLSETSVSTDVEQIPAVASHLSRSFSRHFSKIASMAENVLRKCDDDDSSLTDSNIHKTPSKISSTPSKLASTPLTPMTSTPASQTPKRWFMNADDDSMKLPNKLARRSPLTCRSLKFDAPKAEDVNEAGCSSFDKDIFDIIPENLFLSIQEKERKAIEERNPIISQEKRRRDMIAGLPKLINTIQFFFHSNKCSVTTKKELINKIIASHLDIVDRGELEEKLSLLQEIAPEWISEKLEISGDHLLRINKTLNTQLIREKLAEAI